MERSTSGMAISIKDTRRLSIKVNHVFDNIGVNDEIIKLRRNGYLQIECNETAIKQVISAVRERSFYFGSRSEGTTTLGLKSDMDTVLLADVVRIVHTREEGEMLKAESDFNVFELIPNTNPGYFLLYDRQKSPNLCVDTLKFPKYYKENTCYLKNSFSFQNDWNGKPLQMEGPAIYYETECGQTTNLVWGFPCTAWPVDIAREFRSNQRQRMWPSKDLADQILLTECFFVPKGSDIGENSEIEWRISFSCAERLLMFDLNVVQIRCYILMKYIKSTFLDSIEGCKDVISSYICKTVLFHVISQTQKNVWTEEELLANLNQCLVKLRKFIDERNCPNFIMHSLNLLRCKLNDSKCQLLSEKLQSIIESNGHALFAIRFDDFGNKLKDTHSIGRSDADIRSLIMVDVSKEIISHLGSFWCQFEHEFFRNSLISCETSLRKGIARLFKFSHSINRKEQRLVDAVKVVMCRLSSMLGSLIASNDFSEQRELSDKAFQWLLLGIQCSDAASSYLKFASILYSDGHKECTELVLNDVSKILEGKTFASRCTCVKFSSYSGYSTLDVFNTFSKKSFPQMLRENVGYCIKFTRKEIDCCPKEMQFEMYRTTFCDQLSLPKMSMYNIWLSCAVISPWAFLYFMQYQLYKRMHRPQESSEAFGKLVNLSLDDNLILHHRETTFNLVGQCCEQDGQHKAAFGAYIRSLVLDPKYNAARILICCNLFKLFKMRN